MLNFKVIWEDGNKYVFLKDYNLKREVKKNLIGNEYFEMINYLNKGEEDKLFSRYSFKDRLEDAIQIIKNGDADEFDLFDNYNIHVYYYLDRKIGDIARSKQLSEINNSKIKYMIEYSYQSPSSSISSHKFISQGISDTGIIVSDYPTSAIAFDTEQEAEIFIKNEIIDIAYMYATQVFDYVNRNGMPHAYINRKIADSISNISVHFPDLGIIIVRVFCDMFDELLEPTELYEKKAANCLRVIKCLV